MDLDTRTTDCYRLGTDGLWVLHPFAKEATVSLASVALDITADQLFAEVGEVRRKLVRVVGWLAPSRFMHQKHSQPLRNVR